MKKKLFRKIIISLSLAFTLVSQLGSASPRVCEGIFTSSTAVQTTDYSHLILKFEASTNTSQYLRDNAKHYWKHASHISTDSIYNMIPRLTSYEGLVVGDTHAGNFILAPLKNNIEYFIADIKDAGVAPFIFDINRLLLTSGVVLEKGNFATIYDIYNSLLKSYINGLKGEKYPLTQKLKKYYKTDVEEFEADVQDYIEGKLKKEKLKFKKKEGKVEKIEDEDKERVKTQIKAIVKKQHKKLLDIAIRPRERGGSKDLLRYWALVDLKDKLELIEFKEIGVPAVDEYQTQYSIQEIYENMMNIYWPTRDKNYQVVKIDEKLFWMRPKKVDIMSVKYKQKTEKDFNYNLSLSMLAANYLGEAHASQLNNSNYINALVNNKKQIINELIRINTEYIKMITDEIKNKPKLKNEIGEDYEN